MNARYHLNIKECLYSYHLKATVQATIGGIPLAIGMSCGNIVLSIAVLSILISAPPFGAIEMNLSYKKLLSLGK